MNILSFVALLTEMAHEVEKDAKGMEAAATILQNASKAAIGTYDLGWPPLSPETIARKQTGDSPLLETGTLRDSIEKSVEPHTAEVGTDSKIGEYQELGTTSIPPRSFLAAAAMAHEDEIVDAMTRPAVTMLMTGKLQRD